MPAIGWNGLKVELLNGGMGKSLFVYPLFVIRESLFVQSVVCAR